MVDAYGEDVPQINDLKSLHNWKIIIGTRLKMIGWKTLPIEALDFISAKNLYYSFGEQQAVSDDLLKNFFNYVEYNTLVISLVSRTINYSFGLNLEKVLGYFQEQNLDNQNLQIVLPEEYGESSNLFTILNKTFDLQDIQPNEKYYLSFFALLPLEETNFEDLIDWFGKSQEDNNRLAFTNAITILDSKGLITRKGQQISMHKMLRESVLYQERKGMNCFISQVYNVVYLTKRIKEGADHNLFQALRFLKYGESILSNIKEPYRKSICQPLLQLENEVLNIYNWLKIKVT